MGTEAEAAWIRENAVAARKALLRPDACATVSALLGGIDRTAERARRLDSIRQELVGMELRWTLTQEDSFPEPGSEDGSKPK